MSEKFSETEELERARKKELAQKLVDGTLAKELKDNPKQFSIEELDALIRAAGTLKDNTPADDKGHQYADACLPLLTAERADRTEPENKPAPEVDTNGTPIMKLTLDDMITNEYNKEK